MNNFPLYDTLNKDIPTTDLTTEEKTSFLKNVKQLDENGTELFYALIKVYQLQNESNESHFTVPYGGKYVKKDIKFDLDCFPVYLKHILFKFIQIHVKKMNEDSNLTFKK